jgi:GT2 family glycosyltransferase
VVFSKDLKRFKMNVGFVCVNYNNSKVTIDFILNVRSLNQEQNISIVIVDNASDPDDVARLEYFIRNIDVLLIKSVKNIGYFGGLNLGLEQLNKLEFDYIVIGNNDLNFDKIFLTILEQKNFEKGVLVVCPNIIRPDGIHQNPHVERRFSPLQKFYRKIYFKNYIFGLVLQLIYDLFKKLFKQADRKAFMEEKRILM